MAKETYFFDTYAFFEVLRGNPSYARYPSAHAATTLFNLAEFNFACKREKRPDADAATRKLATFLVPVHVEDICNAMDLRMVRRELSIPDAIGYSVAGRLGIKFLTGDKAFEKMPNVEFVK